MKNLKYYLAAALLGPASYGFAQNQDDALRFSRTQFGGPARTLGIGGATSALGADLGGVLTNPAGLGLFQRSEFSISPGLRNSSTDATAFGSTGTDSRGSLLLNNVGVAFSKRRADDDNFSPWRGGTFSVSLTRINDFNQNLRYSAQVDTTQGNIFQRLKYDQNTTLDALAYEALLTERDNIGTYIPPRDFGRTNQLTQGETIQNRGGQTQFDFGYGASYRDKLYLGGAIGIVSTRYNSVSTLTAVDPAPPSNQRGTAFGSLNLREELDVRGTGINARIGVIYRPLDVVRVGISVQTPTYSQLTETFSSSLDVTYDSPITVDGRTYTSGQASVDPQERAYTLTSPFRATGGAAVVLGKNGFLSADAEYVNYGQARLGNDDTNNANNAPIDFGPANDAVRRLYGSAVNLRVGGEFRYDIFRLRAGFAHYGDPYENNSRFDRSQNFYTAGAGLRQNSFFLDVAGMYTRVRQFYTPYVIPAEPPQTPVVDVNDTRINVTVTAGLVF
ncbi:OmpP1/FadL family transporter [Hymenobacter weizhouensis]|uniref:OmpP1/FadL family transporter n=1 Tax=Hymenobacter sp. YIM 151500-1 TaxID=2987689 RepID=UPI0022267BBA|nr:hypothetical protein [Hymenobacter sp. YIM 151500-1]UYZ62113.1 hypothetical protein OIS53_13990 [Hymenobacter sp. YIM 151500-1]